MKRRASWIASGIGVLGALILLAACGGGVTPTAPNPNAATVVVAFTPNAPGDTLPTLLPTVLVVATQPPPTPIQIIVTATPTLTTTPRSVTAAPRRPSATATSAGTATPFPEGVPKVYVTALRVEPATPKANQGGTFFVTFQNVSGENQAYNWAVEIWDVDNVKHPFGLTAPQNSTMPTGVSNLTSSGWTVKGLGECHGYRARVVSRDENDNRTPFIQRDGTDLWLDLNVCP